MRVLAGVALLMVACAHGSDEPTDPMASGQPGDRVRVMGEIGGYNQGDPQIDVRVTGRTVRVAVASYGGGCHSKGETEVSVVGMVGEVTPWDYTAPPGTPCTQPLLSFDHVATLEFAQAGTATIRIRGIDASRRHAGNLTGEVIVVERQVQLQ